MNASKIAFRLSLALASALLAVSLCLAGYSDLICAVEYATGDTLHVVAHNPTAEPVKARVRVTVRLLDGSSETLTSEILDVSPASTSPLELRASGEFSAVLEGPEPFPPF